MKAAEAHNLKDGELVAKLIDADPGFELEVLKGAASTLASVGTVTGCFDVAMATCFHASTTQTPLHVMVGTAGR